ncbi:MAG: polymerase sigma factor, sigma-70 family [Gemmatimonadetes bacterium]|nr:polymerase sigma factor, sigma-70 family [Gemmatimonadota bacterium]
MSVLSAAVPALAGGERTRGGAHANAPAAVDFDALFRRIYPSLHRYVHRMTGDADAADDIAQEAFVRLLTRTMPEDEARLWLFTVATNLFRDSARTYKRRERLLSAVPMNVGHLPAPDEPVERGQEIERVRAALSLLTPRERTMLLMREEGFRYDEIAGVTDVAPGSVGTLLARALRRFTAAYEGGRKEAR